ncbi:MAG: DegT/DnrJ/EryC1/StrS family aminotransferase [Rhodocyclaceae bacterium]|nr:DegT/DnrJ/EryC1/StrS family aminotransferase [Rhodocyclaceae bacterium]
MTQQTIPFLDLITPHNDLSEELTAIFQSAISTGRFIGGPMVEEFEENFAKFCNAKCCIGVGSGTDALRFALMAAGIKAEEVVVTVPNTFIATTEAISQCGAVPAFVDMDAQTYNMDAQKLRQYLETECIRDEKTGRSIHRSSRRIVSAIVPVHLYGQMADMDAILEIAAEYRLQVIEDACQAHGAEYFSKKLNCWKKAGTMGIASAFSFYPGKNLGACGEAGAVVTDSEGIAKHIRMLRDHGQSQKYHHELEGYNGRLDAIQAGILNVKLKNLAEWNLQRRNSAQVYNEKLKTLEGILTPYEPAWSKGVYHLYVIQTEARDRLQSFLLEQGIGAALHYPIPLHLQKAYVGNGKSPGAYPVCEAAANRILSLPMFPGLDVDRVSIVCNQIAVFFK